MGNTLTVGARSMAERRLRHRRRRHLHGSGCHLHGSRRRLHGSRCRLHGSRRRLHGSRCRLHGSRRRLRGSRRRLQGSRRRRTRLPEKRMFGERGWMWRRYAGNARRNAAKVQSSNGEKFIAEGVAGGWGFGRIWGRTPSAAKTRPPTTSLVGKRGRIFLTWSFDHLVIWPFAQPPTPSAAAGRSLAPRPTP
jgi:hypothetical protein